MIIERAFIGADFQARASPPSSFADGRPREWTGVNEHCLRLLLNAAGLALSAAVRGSLTGRLPFARPR